jgi:cation diffusion facilitator family transporter
VNSAAEPLASLGGQPSGLIKPPKPLERWLLWCSVASGGVILVLKVAAYLITGSAAVLADAAESIVHVVAVVFAAWSLEAAAKPPDREHLYGHEKIAFFSAGAEGALIVMTGMFVFYTALKNWLFGQAPQKFLLGGLLVSVVAVLNGILGTALWIVGRRYGTLIVEANGKHVLSDALTSAAVLLTLLLVSWTGWALLDSVVALGVGTLMVYSGWKLVRRSWGGLLDESDPEVDRRLRAMLAQWAQAHGADFHGLRHRRGAYLFWVDVHLLLPGSLSLEEAHRMASDLENHITAAFGLPAIVSTHLEPLEAHDRHHPVGDPTQEHLAQVSHD